MQKAALTLVGTLLCGMCSATGMADMEIYVDYPVGLWDFYSDGPVNRMSTERVHSYQRSVKIELNAGQVATMYHSWLGEYTDNVVSMGFWIYAESGDINNMRVQSHIRNEASNEEVRLGDLATIPLRQWHYVEFPLQAVHVTPGEILHLFFFKPTTNVVFFLDDIKLLTTPPPTIASININPAIVKNTVSRRSFGAGVIAASAGFESDQNTWNLLRDGGITFFNFPGGVYADYYKWQTTTNHQTGAPFRINTQEYINALNYMGAEGMVTANYGSGTPAEVAAWLNHANNVLGGNIKYWSLGNESYHPGAYDIRPAPLDHDAHTYAAFAVEAITLMKAVDPTVKVGVVVTPNEVAFPQRFSVTNPRTGQSVSGWTAVLLTRMREAGVYPDYLDFHQYTMAPGRESDAVAFQMIDRSDFWIGGIKQMLADYWDGAYENTPINLTESNSVWGDQGKMSVSLTNALYMAYQWGAYNYRGLQSHVWWNVYEEYRTVGNYHSTLYGWRNYTDRGILAAGWPTNSPIPYNTPHPVYYAMRIVDQFADPGDQIVECTTNNLLLKTFAIKSPSGRVRLMVINISKDVDYVASIYGVISPQFVTIHRYGMPHDQSESDYSTQVGYGGVAQFRAGARAFNARFNRYSISVIEF